MSLITDRAVREVTRALLEHSADVGECCQAAGYPMAGYWHGPGCAGQPCRIVYAIAEADLLAYEAGPLTGWRREQVAWAALSAVRVLPDAAVFRIAERLSEADLLAVERSRDRDHLSDADAT